MKRRIIQIDQDKCNGCGACAAACHEGAIGMVDGKAVLLRDDYCDALGDCLPVCPTGAITFVEREAAAYIGEHEAAGAAAASKAGDISTMRCPCEDEMPADKADASPAEAPVIATESVSRLENWPIQIVLAPTRAPYFDGANILVAADCTAYARADFHERFMKGRVVLLGCPKLDPMDYTDKLTEIFTANDINSVTVTRMQVPCCGGIERAVRTAIANSGKTIPLAVVTLSTKGEILE